jgi:hypothetical protein
VRACFRCTLYGSTTALTELSMHAVAAVRDTHIVAEWPSDGGRGDRKYKIRRCAPGGKVLTNAAPTISGRNQFRGNAVSHCPAKASACDSHPLVRRSFTLDLQIIPRATQREAL